MCGRAAHISRSSAHEGWHFFDASVVYRVFHDNAEHPPLGRWLLGIASELCEPIEVLWKGPDPTGHYVLAGRLAPAIAFATLVSLVTLVAGRRWGLAAGAAAGFALVAMPRVFAHAHLAALDTFLSLFWNLALIASDRAVRCETARRGHGSGRRGLGTGASHQDPWLVLAADPCGMGMRAVAAPTWARGNLGLGDGRNLLVRSVLALALVRFLASIGRLLGHGRRAVVDHGPVLRPGRRRS